MHLRDVLVSVQRLNNSQEAVLAESHSLEAQLLERMVLVLRERVTNEDTSLLLKSVVVAEDEARDLALARVTQSLLQIEARL